MAVALSVLMSPPPREREGDHDEQDEPEDRERPDPPAPSDEQSPSLNRGEIMNREVQARGSRFALAAGAFAVGLAYPATLRLLIDASSPTPRWSRTPCA